jgi:N-methylhydantoinase A/oxoprolinase/acetone carboxylase beta subunit
VQLAGFTPSDAAHVLGLQDNWSAEAAGMTARLLVRHRDMAEPSPDRVKAFCRDVWSEVVRLSSRAVLETAIGQPLAGDRLADAVCRGSGALGLAKIGISPCVPVVAVGAPVEVYYGEVGRRLGVEIEMPRHFAIANAVGAASGVVARSVAVEVIGDGSGLFTVLGPAGPRSIPGAAAALAHAEREATRHATAAAVSMGAEAPEVRVRVDKQMLPDAVDENGLFEAVVTAEAVGRPHLAPASPIAPSTLIG